MDDFDKALGERLRTARRHRGWSLQEVEKRSEREFRSSVLGAYERGERAISVQRLHRLAALYRIEVAHLIPDDASEQQPSPVNIDLDEINSVGPDISAVLDRFLVAIQMRRRGTGEMTIRQGDLEVLASLIRADRGTLAQVLSKLD